MEPVQQLFSAIKGGDVAGVQALIEGNPALVNAKDENGVSALLLARYYGRQDVTELLLTQGAALTIFEAAAIGKLDTVRDMVEAHPELVSAYSPDGFPPLNLAAFFGHKDVLEYLLARGADVNAVARNAMNVRPLHSAVAHRQPGVALAMSEVLLRHGADANVRQAGGWTPLHQAAAHGQTPLVRLLLAHGADVHAASEDGRTPLHMALHGGHQETVELLRRHGAEEN
jgi:ankyrin repeat protein